MKKFFTVLAVVLVSLSSWLGSDSAQASTLAQFNQSSSSVLAFTAADAKVGEVGGKIDLNNSDVRDFRNFRGFYPSLASKIIQNAPYTSVEEVLNIPGLSESQKERLQANLDNFVVTDPTNVFNEGDDRYNPGVY
jgi:photosystem II PsbU protein